MKEIIKDYRIFTKRIFMLALSSLSPNRPLPPSPSKPHVHQIDPKDAENVDRHAMAFFAKKQYYQFPLDAQRTFDYSSAFAGAKDAPIFDNPLKLDVSSYVNNNKKRTVIAEPKAHMSGPTALLMLYADLLRANCPRDLSLRFIIDNCFWDWFKEAENAKTSDIIEGAYNSSMTKHAWYPYGTSFIPSQAFQKFLEERLTEKGLPLQSCKAEFSEIIAMWEKHFSPADQRLKIALYVSFTYFLKERFKESPFSVMVSLPGSRWVLIDELNENGAIIRDPVLGRALPIKNEELMELVYQNMKAPNPEQIFSMQDLLFGFET